MATMIIVVTQEPAGSEIARISELLQEFNESYAIWEYKDITQNSEVPLYQGEPITSYPVTGVLWRVTEGKFNEYKNLHSFLSERYTIIKPTNVMALCSDKNLTDAYLAENNLNPLPGIHAPGTYTHEELAKVWESQGVNFDHFLQNRHVAKPASDAGGRGIIFYDGTESEIVLHEGEILQPHMAGEASDLLRVQTVGKEIIGTYRRIPAVEGGMANIEQGAKPAIGFMSPATEKNIRTIIRTLSPEAVGVDVYEADDGTSYIIEINSAPGMNGLEQLGLPAWELILKHLIARSNSN